MRDLNMETRASHLSWRRDWWLVALIVLTPILVMASLIRFASDVGRPFPGLITFYNVMGDFYQPDTYTPVWWTPVRQDASLLTACIRAVDGQPYQDAPQAFAAAAQGQSQVNLTIGCDANPAQSKSIPIQYFTAQQWFDVVAPFAIVSVSLWFLAVLIFHAQPGARLNRVMAMWLLLSAISQGLSRSSLFWHADNLVKLLDLLNVMLTGILGWGAIRVGLVLVDELTNRRFTRWIKSINVLLFGLATVCAGYWLHARLLLWTLGRTEAAVQADGWAFYSGQRYVIVGYLILPVCLLGVLSLYLVVHRRRAPSHRLWRIALCIWLGLTFISPLTLTQMQNALIGSTHYNLFWSAFDLRYFWLLPVSLLAALIVRYQGFRIVQRSSLLLLLIPVVFTSAIGANIINALTLNGQAIDQQPVPLFVPCFLLFMTISALWLTQGSWQGWFGRRFFRQRSYYDAVQSFSVGLLNLSESIDTNHQQALINQLLAQLDVEYAALWTADLNKTPITQSIHFLRAAQASEQADSPPDGANLISLSESQIVRLVANPYLDRAGFQHLPTEMQAVCQRRAVDIVLPLTIPGRLIGFVLIGQRRDQEVFDAAIATPLLLLASQLAFYLQMRNHSTNLFKTRDTVHTDALGLFDELVKEWPNLWKAVRADDETVNALWLTRIRETYRVLRLAHDGHYVQYTLIDLRRLIDDTRKLQHNLGIIMYIEPTLDVPHILQDEIYRWVREGLNNIIKHALAQHVIIKLEQVDQQLILTLNDDGLGLSDMVTDPQSQQHYHGMGYIQQSVAKLDGTVQLVASAPQGTLLQIMLPMLHHST